jgi:acyl homoserine lactone synthase
MLLTLHGYERDERPELFREMFRQRKVVFYDQKKWDVKITPDGLETDEFDRDDTVYLCCMGPKGELLGSLRLLNTVTDHMAVSVFQDMFPGLIIRSPTIWEVTRLVVYDDPHIQPNGVSRATCELLLGLSLFGLEYGVSQITAIYEATLHRVCRRCGLDNIILGRGLDRKPPLYFILLDITRDLEKSIRQMTGLTTDEGESNARAA